MRNYSENNLSLDAIWSDFDYMNSSRNFTIDMDHFADLANLT